MKADLQKLLNQSTDEQLRELVESVYGIDKEVDRAIEAALLANDSTALSKHLKKQVQSLKRGSRFIHYRESFGFSRTLDQLINQIESLLPIDPKATFELIDLFMNTHEKVYNRCDDSGGSVGDSYHNARELWLVAATDWQSSDQPCKLDWLAEIHKRHNNNGYAVWDNLIAASKPLLGDQKLQQLGKQFEAEVVRLAKSSSDSYNSDLSRAEIGMQGVAIALSDITMYERSYQISTPAPNALQKEAIAKFCLKLKDGKSALKWLEGEWAPHFRDKQQKLKDAAYLMLGRNDDLLELRRDAYNMQPDFENLQELLEIAPDKERKQLQTDAITRASKSDNIVVAVDTLLKLKATDAAAAYVLKHPDSLQQTDYYSTTEWAQHFKEHGEPLAAVAAYRVLMLDILHAARSKAYRHAAKYYKALEQLDTIINNYHSLTSKKEFDEQLQTKHGRKRSFWALL